MHVLKESSSFERQTMLVNFEATFDLNLSLIVIIVHISNAPLQKGN